MLQLGRRRGKFSNVTNAVTTSTRAARKGIELLVERLLDALKRHDAATCAALFTDDGVIISPWAPPARGPDAIRATHQAWFDEGEANKRLTVLEANASGDMAYCLLAWSGDYPRSDGSVATYGGTSVNVLQRHANGDWKIQVQSLNSDAE